MSSGFSDRRLTPPTQFEELPSVEMSGGFLANTYPLLVAPTVEDRFLIAKYERLFHRHPGSTVWYEIISDGPIDAPPQIIPVQVGELFLNQHFEGNQLWVMVDRWVRAGEGDVHPALKHRRLRIRPGGKPSWVRSRRCLPRL